MGTWSHRLSVVDPQTQTAVCELCGPVEIRKKHRKGGTGWRCFNALSKERSKRAARIRRSEDPHVRAKVIVADSARSDRTKGLENDLTTEFVAKLISDPCCFCGDTSIKMTLDRIDNSKGHLCANVKAACIRCNYLRRDMPFAAWEFIAKSVRQARELGLFEQWDGTPFK